MGKYYRIYSGNSNRKFKNSLFLRSYPIRMGLLREKADFHSCGNIGFLSQNYKHSDINTLSKSPFSSYEGGGFFEFPSFKICPSGVFDSGGFAPNLCALCAPDPLRGIDWGCAPNPLTLAGGQRAWLKPMPSLVRVVRSNPVKGFASCYATLDRISTHFQSGRELFLSRLAIATSKRLP